MPADDIDTGTVDIFGEDAGDFRDDNNNCDAQDERDDDDEVIVTKTNLGRRFEENSPRESRFDLINTTLYFVLQYFNHFARRQPLSQRRHSTGSMGSSSSSGSNKHVTFLDGGPLLQAKDLVLDPEVVKRVISLPSFEPYLSNLRLPKYAMHIVGTDVVSLDQVLIFIIVVSSNIMHHRFNICWVD